VYLLLVREVTTNHDLSLTKTTHRKNITRFTIYSSCLASPRTSDEEKLPRPKKQKQREKSNLSRLSDCIFAGDPPLVVHYPYFPLPVVVQSCSGDRGLGSEGKEKKRKRGENFYLKAPKQKPWWKQRLSEGNATVLPRRPIKFSQQQQPWRQRHLAKSLPELRKAWFLPFLKFFKKYLPLAR